MKVRPPTRSLASRTTGFSPLAFNSLAALNPENETVREREKRRAGEKSREREGAKARGNESETKNV